MVTGERFDQIAGIIASAPTWARHALTSSDPRVRGEGADELAAFLLRPLDKSDDASDPRQLTLPITG